MAHLKVLWISRWHKNCRFVCWEPSSSCYRSPSDCFRFDFARKCRRCRYHINCYCCCCCSRTCDRRRRRFHFSPPRPTPPVMRFRVVFFWGRGSNWGVFCCFFRGEKEEFFGLINLSCFLCLYLKQLNAKLFIKKKIYQT